MVREGEPELTQGKVISVAKDAREGAGGSRKVKPSTEDESPSPVTRKSPDR